LRAGFWSVQKSFAPDERRKHGEGALAHVHVSPHLFLGSTDRALVRQSSRESDSSEAF
jgi:hypothetical protein